MKQFTIPKAVKLTKAQRQELVEYVEENCRQKIAELRRSMPDEPNLAFYISKAIVGGTIRFKSQEHFLKYLQSKIVGSYSGVDSILSVTRYSGEAKFNNLNAFEIFEVPDGYMEEREKFETEITRINSTIEALEKNLKVVVLKIQVGSDEALQGLVREIDEIGGQLTIMGDGNSTNLLLSHSPGTTEEKR